MDSETYIADKLKDIIVKQLGVHPEMVSSEAAFISDLGADERDAVELVEMFEKQFGIEIPDEEAEKLRTVGDVAHYVRESITEEVFEQKHNDPESTLTYVNFTEELKTYFAKHPERLYDLGPRKFEELIADILKDFGFDTELTSVTRDGGRDVYAYMRNEVTSFLLFVECKRWTPPNHVGIDIVQRMYGTSRIWRANKGMIVTTSFFTAPAKEEQTKISTELDLVDYDGLKLWLKRYE